MTPTPTPTCTETIQQTQQDLRIMFMVDNSGSTLTTDPQHAYRVRTVQQFLGKYGVKQNFAYSFGMFSSASKMFDVNLKSFVSSSQSPFGSAADLSYAVDLFHSQYPSNGTTNYKAAFSSLQTAIVNDTAAGGKWNYVIIFMSDGEPKDISSPIDTNLAKIISDLKTAVQQTGHLVTVSTVYFGEESDTAAIGHLKVIATTGSGQFLDTNLLGGADLVIEDIINVPVTVCPEVVF